MENVKYSIHLLIEMIKNRPVLWDCRNNRNSKEKKIAWKEIYTAMDSRYSRANSTTKAHIEKKITNKWRNVKDIFTRTIKRQQHDPSVKKYMYHDQLSFLLQNLMPPRQKSQRNHVLISAPVSEPELEPELELEPESPLEISEPPSPSLLRDSTRIVAKTEMDDKEEYLISHFREDTIFINSSCNEPNQEEENILKIKTEPNQQSTIDLCHESPVESLHQQSNEDEAFFASILSSIRDLTEAEKLEFRITVLQTIGNIKSKRGAFR